MQHLKTELLNIDKSKEYREYIEAANKEQQIKEAINTLNKHKYLGFDDWHDIREVNWFCNGVQMVIAGGEKYLRREKSFDERATLAIARSFTEGG